jgi:predicted nucleic acid-binding protein
VILVDTSIWIDHFRRSEPQLGRLLHRGDVITHAFIIGELLLGNVSGIDEMMGDLNTLPKGVVAGADEILAFISLQKLNGSGIGYVDAHLLASTALTPETKLWTRDKRLLTVARSLSLAANLPE